MKSRILIICVVSAGYESGRKTDDRPGSTISLRFVAKRYRVTNTPIGETPSVIGFTSCLTSKQDQCSNSFSEFKYCSSGRKIIGMPTKYDVALSFAGEDRSIAREIAIKLKKAGIKVFFDEHSSAELWGKNLFEYLQKVFTNSKLCIVLLSENYTKNRWTNNEFRNLLAHSHTRPSFSIITIQIGKTSVTPDLSRFVHIRWDSKSSKKLVQTVKERLASLSPSKPTIHHENFHVIKRDTGWSVKRGGSSRAASVHKTRKQAISSARKLAKRSKKAVVVVHRIDGSIEKTEQGSKE